VPSVFEVGDDDVLRILDERPDAALQAAVEQAAALCPKQAISVVQE
jgi:ferredoxin